MDREEEGGSEGIWGKRRGAGKKISAVDRGNINDRTNNVDALEDGRKK